MRLDYPPKYTEKIGAIKIHSLQKVYEMDSGQYSKSKRRCNNQTTMALGNNTLASILKEMAIIIPVKNEKISLLEGVLSGIPNECSIIIVSNSQRAPVDRYAMEVEMIKQYACFSDKEIMTVHQMDENLVKVFQKLEYSSILDSNNQIRSGKAEGMIIGILMSKLLKKKYVGFVDADNYFPGAINEYIKIFASGFAMTHTPYTNVRICWHSKPKIVNNELQFPKWGRVSEHSNKYLNDLISFITGSERDIITTANAGEHAISMKLAEDLNFSSGYSVEPYELINMIEKYGDTKFKDNSTIIKKGIEIFQIETRNPHLHENKGNDHLTGMLEESLQAINNSKICTTELTKDMKNHLLLLQEKSSAKGTVSDQSKNHIIMEPLKTIQIDQFSELISNNRRIFRKFNFKNHHHTR